MEGKLIWIFVGVAFFSATAGFVAGMVWEKLGQVVKKSRDIHDSLKKFGAK